MTGTSTPLYYVPETRLLELSTGAKEVVVRGVGTLSDAVVNDVAATRAGIKPEHEMTAAERAAEGLEPPLPDYVEPPAAVEPPSPPQEPTPPYAPPGAAGTAAPTDRSEPSAQGSAAATPAEAAAAEPSVGPATKS